MADQTDQIGDIHAEVVVGASPMDAERLLALGDDGWRYDGWRYELVDGRLVRMAPTGMEHRDIWMRLFRALDRHVEAHALGALTPPDTGFRLPLPDASETVLSPDIGFIQAGHAATLPPAGSPERRKFLPLAPDLAVEIASPDQRRPEMAEKARRYPHAGSAEVWIIWPAQQQVDVSRRGARTQLTLTATDQLQAPDIIPGFTFPIARLFADVQPAT